MMTPDDVPLHFSRETIVVAVSTCLMGGSLVFDRGEEADVLGRLFAIYVGTRLSDGPDDPVQARDAFVEWMRGHAPDGSQPACQHPGLAGPARLYRCRAPGARPGRRRHPHRQRLRHRRSCPT
jgi:hypothetical protein